MKPERRLAPDIDLIAYLKSLSRRKRRLAVEMMGSAERDALDRAWPGWAHDGQRPPVEDWRTWVIMAGRGFGKTLAGSKWITAMIGGQSIDCPPPSCPPHALRIALVGATLDEARRVMVEGRSGLIEVAGAWVSEWHPSLRRLRFRTGAEACLFSGASPESLRGPEHHLAWCDELAKWEKPRETWDMLQLGLRLGRHPRALITTTPRPGPALRAIMAEPDTIVTGGPTRANPHLAPGWQEAMANLYAGTRLGRQELDGELLTDAPGALWTVELLERCRAADSGTSLLGVPDRSESATRYEQEGSAPHCPATSGGRGNLLIMSPGPPFTRLVIAVDPPSGAGTCGIIACAKDSEDRAHILADHSVANRTPEGWSRAVADAARMWGHIPMCPQAQVVAEQNQGGKMVAAVLRTADPNLNVKLVTATVGKSERAAPVAMLFEAGRVVLHGRFPELEAELLGMIAGGDYEGPGVSPDRADAMVWGLTELMLAPEQAPPRVRTL